MSEPHYKAYLLHQRPYRETSVIVDLLSETEGRVRAVCKGVRGAGKRAGSLRAALQPFAELSLQLGGRTELKSLRQVERLDTAFDLTQHRLYAALYINELLVRLLHVGEVHAGLYEDYRLAVGRLAVCADSVSNKGAVGGGLNLGGDMKSHAEITLRLFEFRLLAALGFAIDFSFEVSSGRSVESTRQYHFDAGDGFTLAPDGSDETAAELFSGECLQALQRKDLSDPVVRRAAKKIARAALAPHLGSRPLKSRELYRRPS